MDSAFRYEDITTSSSVRLPRSGVAQWDEQGVLHLKGLIPAGLIDVYLDERRRMIGNTALWDPGWPDAIPYLRVPSMKTLSLHRPLTEAIARLMGPEEPGLHLTLTGFKSTERAWHQDRYLSPEAVGERYVAAWIVLDDVHPDSGPFEYVPGSHRWAVIERGKVWDRMRSLGQNPDAPSWPAESQGWVSEVCQAEVDRRHARPTTFLGKRGDVLLWHASLLHRGSVPRNAELERRALICHYSAITARPDMPAPTRAENGSYFFDFNQPPVSTMAANVEVSPVVAPATAPLAVAAPRQPGLRARLREFWKQVRDEAG